MKKLLTLFASALMLTSQMSFAQTAESEKAVYNETTGVGYDDLKTAVDAAENNNIIIINDNTTISSRITNGQKNITIKGAQPNVQIIIANGTNIPFISNQKNYTFAFKDIVISGDNNTFSNELFQTGTGNAFLEFENVKITNTKYTNDKGFVVIKAGGKVNLNGLSFENCTRPENTADVFIGGPGSTISGDNKLSISFEIKDNTNYAIKVNGELTNKEPIQLIAYKNAQIPENYILVKGLSSEEDASKFTVGNDGYTLKYNNGELTAENDIESAVNELIFTTSGTPVEYYNLQGVKVANPENGIFIRVQGKDVKKVVIK